MFYHRINEQNRFFFDFRPLATSEVGSEINLLPYIEAAEELSNSAIKSKIA